MKGPETPQPGSTRHNAVGKAQLPWQSSSSAVTDLVSPRARPVVLALPVRRTGGALRGGGARRALGSEDSTASVGSYSYNPNGLRTSNFGSTTASYSSNARNYLTGYQNNTYAYDADADGDSSRSSSDSDASSADANTGLPSYSSVVSGETSSGSLSYTTTSSVYNAAQQLCWSSSPAVALGGSPGGCSTPPKGATAYSYDPSGRLTSVSIPQPSSTNTVSLSYGPYGNLACFAPPNSSGYNCSGNPWKGYTSTYTYNADHLRMSVTPDGASTQIFAWDTVSSSVARIISDATNYYIYGPNILGGAPEPVEQIPVGATTASSASYLVFSPRSLRMIISSVGQVDNFYFCSAWGNCGACATLTGTCSPGPVTSPFGFAGGYTDSSGLVYLINRYYAPMLREFISVDPAVATTGTPYAYAGNDPMNWVDPSGLCWPSWACGVEHFIGKHWRGIAQVAIASTAVVVSVASLGSLSGPSLALAAAAVGALSSQAGYYAGCIGTSSGCTVTGALTSTIVEGVSGGAGAGLGGQICNESSLCLSGVGVLTSTLIGSGGYFASSYLEGSCTSASGAGGAAAGGLGGVTMSEKDYQKLLKSLVRALSSGSGESG